MNSPIVLQARSALDALARENETLRAEAEKLSDDLAVFYSCAADKWQWKRCREGLLASRSGHTEIQIVRAERAAARAFARIAR